MSRKLIEPIRQMSIRFLRQHSAAHYATKPKTLLPKSDAKIKQASTVKALYKENKAVFGDLLESKKDRVKKKKQLAKRTSSNSTEEEDVCHEDVLFSQSDLGPGMVIAARGLPRTKTRASVSVPDRSTNIIRKYGEHVRGHEQSEVEWAVKNFPARTKVISRGNPEKIKYAFDETGPVGAAGSSVILQELSSRPGETRPKVEVLASVGQFVTSFQDCQDVRGGLGETVVFRKEESAEEVDVETQQGVSANSSSHHDSSPAKPAPQLLSSAGYRLFPYDNPNRTVTSSQNNLPQQIISLPYPRRTTDNETMSSTDRIPSVSKILNATMPPEQVAILKKWEQKMIAQMGEEGFKNYKEGLFRNGKELHGNLESLLRGTPMEEILIAEPIRGHWKSLLSILTQVQDVQVLESHVTHPELRYSGILDCVATFKDKLVLIDWKTSEKPKPFVSSTYDTPLQIAAYIGAINYDPNYSLKIKDGLIVVAYQSGQPGQTFHLKSTDIEKYWKMWIRRLNLFKSQQN